MSTPIHWRWAGGLTAAALRGVALNGWLSVCGLLLVLRELPFPFMQQFLRRHARFATTTSGRSTMHVFAATLAFSSGSAVGALVGIATLANILFGRHVNSRMRAMRRARMPSFPPMMEAPPAEPFGVLGR